ncbi:tryptophan synthase alpha chain [Bisgaardia hudsonensis]|uniref:Tryptophan synthase alpha chain n=1 Tax=Bisgaardia hudsonensis TaxID=109472 RepID=A0A4R2N0I1_9PAST|nr:tryptophan synthase subunit alpha [Bisgaardia hudsonensis]QLB13471.1 tryptophan synthase subunit alpha [Bisgaardia hudsonensis]TCP12880.1 tryptophan synthase alpha chain [Bisgaardia hudsonensis]
MNRFEKKFTELDQANQGAFVPFVTLCDPDFDRSFEIICTLIDNGADALELGFPFSDPLLDGEVIQAANQRALSADCSSKESFALLKKVRSIYPNIPISLLLCTNLVYAQTLETFYKNCEEVGIDAVLIADLPLFAATPYREMAKKYHIQPVFICPPNASSETIQEIAKYSEGYVYLVSRAGVTSAENQTYSTNLTRLINQLKQYNSPPILQGFGIATTEQVKKSLTTGVSGVISGSATVKIIEKNLQDHSQCLIELAKFTKEMKSATFRSREIK